VELFNRFFDAGGSFEMLSRAGHILAGITWIGLLYFFNFVQTPAFAQLSDGARGEALRKITFRALWWFRWAAAATFVFGLLIISVQDMSGDDSYFSGQRGTAILTGMLFGTTMFLNVWGIIWRAQKVMIGSSEAVANGGTADPRATPELAKGAARASRTNTFFSITMLFFMVFAAHGAGFWGAGDDRAVVGGTVVYWIIVLVLWAFVELSALGYIGGLDSPFNKLVFDDHRNTIIYGFVYLAIIYFIGWELLLPA
jgi:uncharacterized membrane protein